MGECCPNFDTHFYGLSTPWTIQKYKKSRKMKHLHAPLHLSKAEGGCCPNFEIDFCGLGTGGMLPKFWYPCTLQKHGRMLPKFWYSFLWLEHSLDHPKVVKITSKSTQNRSKISKSWYLGWLWAPLGSPWGHLELHLGPGCQKPSKSDLVDPPQGVPKEVIFEHFRCFLGYLFWYQFLCIFATF